MLELGLVPPIKPHFYLRMPCPFFFPDAGRFSESRVLQSSQIYHRLPLPRYRLINMLNSMVPEAHELGSLIRACKVLAQVLRKAQTRSVTFVDRKREWKGGANAFENGKLPFLPHY